MNEMMKEYWWAFGVYALVAFMIAVVCQLRNISNMHRDFMRNFGSRGFGSAPRLPIWEFLPVAFFGLTGFISLVMCCLLAIAVFK